MSARIEVQPKNKENFGKTVRRLALSGALMISAGACEKKPVPDVPLSDILKNPNEYTQLAQLTTTGYPEKTGQQTLSLPMMSCQPGTAICSTSWISTQSDTYALHTEPTRESPSITVIINGFSYMPIVPLDPAGPQLIAKEKYSITGKLDPTKDDKNNTIFALCPKKIKIITEGDSSTTPQGNK